MSGSDRYDVDAPYSNTPRSGEQSLHGGVNRQYREDQSDSADEDESNELLGSIMDSLRQAGISVTSDQLTVTPDDVPVTNTPSDAEWKDMLRRFYSGVNATRDVDKQACFSRLISELILNTTSNKRDKTRKIQWPTGEKKCLDEVVIIPAGFTLRNFFSHKHAQLVASSILAVTNNRDFVTKHRVKNGYGPEYPAVAMFDFVSLANNPHARQAVDQYNIAKKIKTRGSQQFSPVAYGKHDDESGGNGRSKEVRERYQDSLY